MKRSSLVIGLVLVCIAIGAAWVLHTPSTKAPETQAARVSENTGAPPPVPVPENTTTPPASEVAPLPPGTIPPTTTGGSPPRVAPPSPPEPMAEVRTEIENLQVSLRDFRTVLGENPVGTNAEITQALTGNNVKQLRLAVPAGSSVNADGEMCDRWGTPYFFHQLSAKQMEIHSAGPDRKMGTGDDLVVK